MVLAVERRRQASVGATARRVRGHVTTRATVMRWHPTAHSHHTWNRVAVLVDWRRRRHPRAHTLSAAGVGRHRHIATVAHVSRLRPCSLSTATWTLLLLAVVGARWLNATIVTEMLLLQLISFAWLTLLSSVAEPDLALQDVSALHLLNALLGGLLAAKLDEAEAFRVLGDGVHDDLGLEAARVVLLESGEEHLVVHVGVQIAHVHLSFIAQLLRVHHTIHPAAGAKPVTIALAAVAVGRPGTQRRTLLHVVMR